MAASRSAPILVALIVVSSLAGCLATDPLVGPDDVTGQLPVLEDALAALEAGSPRANVARLAEYDDVGGGQELDAWGDYLAVMRNPKLIIVNVSDPVNPHVESELQMTAVMDVKWSDDGKYIFVGNDDGEGSVSGVTDSARQGGFYVVDATDKEAPEVVDFLPIGPRRGPHMVTYHRMPDGSEIVVGANGDVSIARFDRETVTLTEIARYQVDPTTVDRTPERFDVLYGVPAWAHDMHVQTEPDGSVLMYVAHWDAGLRIVDISDPADPKEIGAWMEFPEGHSGNLHTVTTDWFGDRRITVGTPELGFSVVGGYHYAQGDELTGVYVWDTTDPADIELLSYWSHPKEECRYAGRDMFGAAGEEITSSHNLQFEQGRAYVAHYACGTVVLDLSTPELWQAPRLLAYDMGEDLIDTWDVILHRGVMYLGEATYVIAAQFALDATGPEGVSSRA